MTIQELKKIISQYDDNSTVDFENTNNSELLIFSGKVFLKSCKTLILELTPQNHD